MGLVLRIWSHLLKKFFMENSYFAECTLVLLTEEIFLRLRHFCAVIMESNSRTYKKKKLELSFQKKTVIEVIEVIEVYKVYTVIEVYKVFTMNEAKSFINLSSHCTKNEVFH